jgi:hypothetical protein
MGDRSYQAHVWRLAHDIDGLSDENATKLLLRLITETPEVDRARATKLAADADALRRSVPWVRALRTMREMKWSSY